VDNQAFAAIPTDINTFKQQIQSTTRLVEKSVTFEFTTYMSTQGTTAANVLYQDYADYFQIVTAPVLGDYNTDGAVDPTDYNEWRSSFGSTGELVADGNSNGVIDAADYVVWRDNLGAGLGSAAADVVSVPEAHTLLFAVGALMTLTMERWVRIRSRVKAHRTALGAKEATGPC